MPTIVFHVGYPKTATTTLQEHLFGKHSQIDYLGKYVPSHGYRSDAYYPLVNSLMVDFECDWTGGRDLADLIARARSNCARRCVLLSSENFIHPWSQDPIVVARRLAAVVPDARILVTIREQASLLLSFYRWHGAFGQYLYMNKYVDEVLDLPLPPAVWLEYQFRSPSKNLLGYLHYDRIVTGYQHAFGRDAVHVMVFEAYRDTPARFIASLAETLSIDAAEALALLDGRAENDRLDPRFAGQTDYIADAEFDASWRRRIAETFRPGNAALASKRSLPLGVMGYAV